MMTYLWYYKVIKSSVTDPRTILNSTDDGNMNCKQEEKRKDVGEGIGRGWERGRESLERGRGDEKE